MKNLINDILSTANFKSAVYFHHGFCNPWGMKILKGDFAQFHIVTQGNCIVNFGKKSLPLEKGDIIIFPHGSAHEIKDDLVSICLPGKKVVADILSNKKPFKGKRISSHLICGHYELNKDLSHPIFEQLPNLILIKSNEYGRADLIQSVFELIVEEQQQKNIGFQKISLQLSEILFISIIRHFYQKKSSNNFNLFKDEKIYTVINLIHRDLALNWNIEKLARQIGISRTLFIDRFKRAVGVTPMKYVFNWRMTKAKFLLKTSDLTLVQIGEQIGYFSESSFNRAFKQKFQITPGKFRAQLN